MEGNTHDNPDTALPMNHPPTNSPSNPRPFSLYTTATVDNIEPKIPKTPKTPFNTLNGLHAPVPQHFFSIFEPQMSQLAIDQAIDEIAVFNQRLLEYMGFPPEHHDVLSSWAMVEAGIIQIHESENGENPLREARKILKETPDDKVNNSAQAIITQYNDNKLFDNPSIGQVNRHAFDQLWFFLSTLFASPFRDLSSDSGSDHFQAILDTLSHRTGSIKKRKIETVSTDLDIS